MFRERVGTPLGCVLFHAVHRPGSNHCLRALVEKLVSGTFACRPSGASTLRYHGKIRHHNHSRFNSDLQSAIRKLTQFSKCSSHSMHTSSFHSRLEPNKFRSPSVKAGHNCTKLATAEQNLMIHEMRNKTPQSFRHIPNVSSRSQQPQELYSLSIPHPRGLMRT